MFGIWVGIKLCRRLRRAASARNAAGVCQHIYPFTPLELTFDGGTDSLFETFAFNIDNCVSPYIGVGVWCVDN